MARKSARPMTATAKLERMLHEHAEHDAENMRQVTGEAAARIGEYDDRIAKMIEAQAGQTAAMDAHIVADAKAFETLAKELIEINRDVKSLIADKNFVSGAWKAAAIIGGALTTLAGFWFAYQSLLQKIASIPR